MIRRRYDNAILLKGNRLFLIFYSSSLRINLKTTRTQNNVKTNNFIINFQK
jgi:hypothetical protein